MSSKDTLHENVQKEISELTASISEVVAGFRKLQRPLIESHDKVPQATSQLDKITEQTEAVTAQMLDMVEKLTQREDEVLSGLETIREKIKAGETDSIDSLIETLVAKTGDNINEGYQIMEALQFQDITAQQMDHAASLLEDVEVKLHGIINSMGDSRVQGPMLSTTSKKRAYDPNADMVTKKTDQDAIDSIFANGQK
ncbi:MAG: protein phosphatase CheZ [candidate division Zixibacteria bacterium]|nr:protein phosphatase CheZ [candidate division Zixibacteria bacterium]